MVHVNAHCSDGRRTNVPQRVDERLGRSPLRARSHHGRRHGHRNPGAHRASESEATSSTSHPTWRPQSPLATTRLVATSARALLQMPAGHVAHIHLSERGSFLREGSLVALAHRRGLVTVATIHGASFIPFARKCPWLVSTVLRHADLVTCLDQGTLDCVRRSAPDVVSEIVPNPVFVDASFSPADGTEELVVFAGEIGRRKGADVLYRAWQLVAQRRPRARCLMVGPVGDFAPPERGAPRGAAAGRFD